jgi:hypothetical protein
VFKKDGCSRSPIKKLARPHLSQYIAGHRGPSCHLSYVGNTNRWIELKASLGKNARPTGVVAQALEHLPTKPKVLSSNLSMPPKIANPY